MVQEPLSLTDLCAKPVDTLKSVGENLQKPFNDLGIHSVADLLRFYPTRYLDRTQTSTISSLSQEEATIFGTVLKVAQPFKTKKRNLWIVNVELADDEGTLFKIVFFNQPWRSKQLQEGMNVTIFGKLDSKLSGGKPQITHPLVDMVGDQTGRIVPLYSLPRSKKIYPPSLFRAVAEALRRSEQRGIADPLDKEIREELDLMTREQALNDVHSPQSFQDVREAKKRLAFDELLCIQLVLLERRKQLKKQKGINHHTDSGEFALAKEFIEKLPYKLTQAQQTAISQIQNDLKQDAPMHRLLQGDVGSGKTIVALAAILSVIEAGNQAAFLVPTEVLAEQHYGVITGFLNSLFIKNQSTQNLSQLKMGEQKEVEVELLTNRITGAYRKDLLNRLKDGAVDLVVGTSALIYEGVDFKSLGLVVVDEQHRFGVDQRASLKEKSGTYGVPDSLAMTATPIPRTVALTIYGDLEISVLDELPKGRLPIKTYLITNKKDEVPMWEHIRQEVSQNRQAYVVCPLIGDEDINESDSNAESPADFELEFEESPVSQEQYTLYAEQVQHTLQKLDPRVSTLHVCKELSTKQLKGLRLEVLHGRLDLAEKNSIMEDFRKGNIDVLISTTVIEVGIDIPNASLMVILGAYRFGIAQLHQLRGRVGRSHIQSHCYLVSDISSERLQVVADTTDGFILAEKDLEFRREGTLLGQQQTGKSDLKAASLIKHRDLIDPARNVAEALLSEGLEPQWQEEINFLLGEETQYLQRT